MPPCPLARPFSGMKLAFGMRGGNKKGSGMRNVWRQQQVFFPHAPLLDRQMASAQQSYPATGACKPAQSTQHTQPINCFSTQHSGISARTYPSRGVFGCQKLFEGHACMSQRARCGRVLRSWAYSKQGLAGTEAFHDNRRNNTCSPTCMCNNEHVVAMQDVQGRGWGQKPSVHAKSCFSAGAAVL